MTDTSQKLTLTMELSLDIDLSDWDAAERGRWGVHHGKGPWWNDITEGVDVDAERDDCYYIYERQTGTVYAIIPALHPEIITPSLILRQFENSQGLVSAINQAVYDIGDREGDRFRNDY